MLQTKDRFAFLVVFSDVFLINFFSFILVNEESLSVKILMDCFELRMEWNFDDLYGMNRLHFICLYLVAYIDNLGIN